MDAVTQHGAQPCPIESLAQKIFAHSRLAPRHMGARHQVAPQQRAQCVGIEPVRLDLRIGNQPRLVGMGQHHLLYPFELFKLIVNAAPIPARFHYGLAWPSQARKKLSETKRRVALHAGFSQLPASLIHCAKHTVLLVNVYSNVIHENSSFLFFSTLRTEGLLSFYLTPISTLCRCHSRRRAPFRWPAKSIRKDCSRGERARRRRGPAPRVGRNGGPARRRAFPDA